MLNQNLLLTGDDAYNLTKSLRFRSSATGYLNRTPASAGNRKTWTWSGWVKRGTLGTNQSLFTCYFANNDTSYLTISFTSDNLNIGLWNTSILYTSAVYRDPSAWYHIVLAIDTTQATASDRAKLYVNGTQVTAFGSTGYPAQNTDLAVNSAAAHYISTYDGTNYKFDGYMADINFVDGQALTPNSFGTFNGLGVWQPRKYAGTYGTNGFYLPFTDNSGATSTTIGKDFSGNSNNWTPNNISVTAGVTYDSMTDVPTLTDTNTANYAVLNPLDAQGTATLSDANLTLASATTAHKNRKATFVIPNSGKWYWELTTASTCSSSIILGWGLQTTSAATDSQAGNADTWMAQNDANQDIWNQTTNILSTGSAVAGGSIRQVAYDADTGKLWFGINNTWYSSTDLTSGNPSAGTNQCMTLSSGNYFPTITCYNLTANANFGQRPFAYTPPTGFVALNTFNLPTPTIGATASTTANKYFDATTFTGNASTNVITNSGSMQPDMVWLKSRSNANNHTLYDSIRGVNTLLYPNLTNSEAVGTNQLTSFNSNGFTLGASENANDSNGETSVGWQWRASNTTAVTNTAGSITSTVSANTTAGFSIVTYTGTGANATVGHGLGVAPSMIMIKCRTGAATNWLVYHQSLSANGSVFLNLTDAYFANSAYWQNTAPTSTVFSIGTAAGLNTSTVQIVAYCFAQVAGYSAFGSYTGNGSSDGPFIYTGFRPRYVMIKQSSTSGEDWYISDTSRDTYNQSNTALFADLSNAEASNSARGLDILSNGIKLRGTSSANNTSGATYIYMAFAENPFKYANAR